MDDNGYAVTLEAIEEDGRSTVVLTAPSGDEVLRRTLPQEQAEVLASTIRQHIAWLSAERLSVYYPPS